VKKLIREGLKVPVDMLKIIRKAVLISLAATLGLAGGAAARTEEAEEKR